MKTLAPCKSLQPRTEAGAPCLGKGSPRPPCPMRCRQKGCGSWRCKPIACHASSPRDVDAVQEGMSRSVNQLCTDALRAMLAGDERAAEREAAKCRDLAVRVAGAGRQPSGHQYQQTVAFLSVLEQMLQHNMPSTHALDEQHARSLDRLLNQISGSEWKVGDGDQAAQEPQFSTWEEALGGGPHPGAAGPRRDPPPGASRSQPGRHTALYNDLGVTGGATRADIRAAFRKGALTWHPDVNAAPEAPARFARLAEAYEVLYDEELRRSYDREGPRGVEAAVRSRASGAGVGTGEARRAWDEFKPFRKENRRTQARAAAGPRSGSEGSPPTPSSGAIPVGSVVQYALSPAVLALEEGHRSSGIGLLVGRNMDRGDASRLPPERLGLCEVEAFRQTEAGSSCWCPDDLASPAFCHLDDLRPIPVAAYDARFDRWTIEEVLPDGCAGPDLPEEIIL
ncbi:hypothetical protein ACKKBG_A29235 [Auxenochlorella protothecoides x Auxenochlorella symbiontica]